MNIITLINIIMKKIFLFFVLASNLIFILYGQDYPVSVGPSPVSNQKINQESQSNQVGSRYFAQISSSPTFQIAKAFLETCTVTNIGAPFTITFPGGLMLRNGILYTWNQSSPFQMWSVDTVTGIHSFIFNMTGVPQANFTGMCWDGEYVYGVTTNLTVSQIFRVNMITGVCTTIGPPQALCAGAINLMGVLVNEYSPDYSLFSVDIVLDNLYKFNKTTGAASLVGPLGANANFGQDGCVDPHDNTFYWMAYTTGPELRKIDTATGAAGPVLCTYSAQATGIACGLSGLPPYGVTNTICRRELHIAVPDNNPAGIRDTIRMIGNSGMYIIDINVRLDTFIHTWDGDVAFTLSHNSTAVALITNRGGSGDNFIRTSLNDSAINPISSGTAPFTGLFRSEQSLSSFNNLVPTGDWILFMTDNAAGDTGFLQSWCIIFQMYPGIGIIKTSEIPFVYRLTQNYPNPFNPVTTIKYGLPKFGKTNLIIYDILGRVAAKLVDNEFKDAGTYEVQWNASNFSSGIYFYTLESGNYSETKKMVVIK
jgi:hypothetical protein